MAFGVKLLVQCEPKIKRLVQDEPKIKLLVQGEPKIKQETYFMVVVLWGVTAIGKAETLQMFRRNFLLLHSG